jgi:hypothetical protein
MHILHEHHQIQPRIAKSLHKSCPDTLGSFQAYSIALDSIMRELALLFGQPACCERHIGKKPNSDNGYSESDDTLNDKQPARKKAALAFVPESEYG